MGNIDKTIRLLIAIGIIFYFGFLNHSWWWLISLVPLFTAVYGFCPLYRFIGKNGGECPFRKNTNKVL
ncbi:DUF2892 domain-containing protein [Helicobacter didelphidarum]|uniref:DUF2892 domain-containing protein n=1 Tax=Helicobacter didelphidarum TaxID=2040648 RepID=A0A3D8IN29_9HELI|nr:DUF2892 domain-containing protein [Helicobacter didelphidarum]RDU65981.1 DUF2892 domain-containing protein [Helicobacter didelphidarum]